MHAGPHPQLNSVAPPLHIISTEGVTVSERREFWQSGGSFLFGALQLEQHGREPFDARLFYTGLGDLIFCRLAARVAHRAVRTKAVALRDDRPFFKAVLQTKGRSVIAQRGCTTQLLPGEWVVYDAAQAYSVSLNAGAELSMILVPREKIVMRGFDLRSFVLRPFSARRGFGKLIWNLLDTTMDQISELQNHFRSDVAEIAAQMFRTALFDSFDGRSPVNSSTALRERVKFYISAHLSDPDLSIAKLAELSHCSKRYLHLIFRAEGVSISDYILKSRLERCHAEFQNPASAHRSITDIAYSWGFNNSNHFSRCFKREFGIPPRELRSDLRLWPRVAVGATRPS